jgi:ABC-type phosphate transport system permease subunit
VSVEGEREWVKWIVGFNGIITVIIIIIIIIIINSSNWFVGSNSTLDTVLELLTRTKWNCKN